MFALQLHEPDIQNAFCFTECAPPAVPIPSRVETPKPKRPPMAVALEEFLRRSKLPYINVDEHKRALFAGAKLKAFHFLVYRPTSPNWLIWAARGFAAADRFDLGEWEKIFGDGFVAVKALEVKGGGFKFRRLDGVEVIL